MKNSLMLWTLSVLLLSVIIECRNKTAEEKHQHQILQEVDNSTLNNSTVNQTEIKEEFQSKGSLGEAKDTQFNRLNGKYSHKKKRTNPAARTELNPAARAESNPAARTVLNPAARAELNPAARKNENKRPRRHLSDARKRNH